MKEQASFSQAKKEKREGINLIRYAPKSLGNFLIGGYLMRLYGSM